MSHPPAILLLWKVEPVLEGPELWLGALASGRAFCGEPLVNFGEMSPPSSRRVCLRVLTEVAAQAGLVPVAEWSTDPNVILLGKL